MGSEKDASSETSSDDQETGHSKDGFGRSYECNFCKRGFTNAQALGGHMNIHRKDKAKAKQHKSFTNKTSAVSVNSVKSFPNYKDHHHHHHSHVVSSNSFNLVTNDQEPRYLSSSFGIRSSDHVYDQFSTYDQLGYGQFSYNQFTLPNPNPAIHEENSRVNLNLGIGTSEMEDDDNIVEDDIDLELRLGH